jgi:hypothetical protein
MWMVTASGRGFEYQSIEKITAMFIAPGKRRRMLFRQLLW